MTLKRQQGWALRGLFPRSITSQLVAGTVLVQVLVLGLFLVLEMHHQRYDFFRSDRSRVVRQAHLLAEQAAGGWVSDDLGQLNRIAQAMKSSISVGTARITDLKGNVLGVNRDGQQQLDDTEHALLAQIVLNARPGTFERNSVNEGYAPILINGHAVGIAWIISDAHAVYGGLTPLFWAGGMYAVCALTANLLLVWLLTRNVVRPLVQLNRATRQVVHGSIEMQMFPLPVTSRNEAGELTRSFNEMVRELQVQRSGLQETLSLLDSMLENAPVGFAFFDSRLRYIRANHHLGRILGLEVGAQLGRTMSDLFQGEVAEQMEKSVQFVFEHGTDLHDVELRGRLDDSALSVERTWICNFYPVHTVRERVRWVGMVMVEMTNRVRQEEAMRRSEKLAAAGRIAASIAHEINNPLESVTNLLYLVRHHPSLDSEAEEYAALAQRELTRVSEITQQTLRFYRSSLKQERVALAELVKSVLGLFASRIQGANIRTELRMDPAVELMGMSGELRQVFANLVGNAIDAMSGGGGSLRIRVSQRGEHACITVADTGTGMTQEVLKRIFEAFYTTKEATGTGLGLWVSAEIIQKHQGNIQVRSQVGKGTVFRLTFPNRAS